MNELETYDKVVAINVDIQNDFCPGGKLAVTDGDQVIEPMNTLNRWVRDQNGYVIFTRDWHPRETDHFKKWPVHCVQWTAGAAFPDELKLEYEDIIASKGQSNTDDGYSGWQANMLGGRLYRMGDGRDMGAHTVHDAMKEMVGVYYGKRQRVAILVGGLATDYCNKETVLDALRANEEFQDTMEGLYQADVSRRARLKNDLIDIYRIPKTPPVEPISNPLGVFVLQDAMRAVNLQPSDGAKALAEMKAAGAVLTTTEEVINGEAFKVRTV